MYNNLERKSEIFKTTQERIQPATLIDGRIVSCLDLEVISERKIGKPVSYRLQEKSTAQVLSQLSWPELKERLNRVMLAYLYEDYSRIKEHEIFRKIYGRGVRPVHYLKNGTIVAIPCETFICMNCGIILPENLITIDHHKPQMGGALLALLKVFRACGLTLKGPWGIFGQTYLGYANQSYIHLASALMNSNVWPIISPGVSTLHDFDYEDRNTLTSEGTLIYSVLIWSGDIARVMQNCMDSLLNLKPLCHSCNSSKGNDT